MLRTSRQSLASRWFRPLLEQLEHRDVPSSTLPLGFVETTVASGLSSPTAMEFAPDGRLFVLEKGGNVKLIRDDGSTFTALHLNVDTPGERGLLGIAFDPNFATNHFVYLYFTNPNAAGTATGVHNQISRFTVNDTNPQKPSFGNAAPILDLTNLSGATNHNGGGIHFGSDGMLYVGVGENGNPANSQTLVNLLGKYLRINTAGYAGKRDDATVGHIIPPDNPFVGTAKGLNQLIFALGLRNPYTSAVDPKTGTIYINDVGQNTWEEINQATAGANYGWDLSEGFKQPGDANTTKGTYQDPLLAYNHSGGPAGGGDAIVGGTFYNPPTASFPAQYVGKYFYEDLSAGWIRVFDPANPGSLGNADTGSFFASGDGGGTVDLKVDAAGNLYYVSAFTGVVKKISYPQPVIQPLNEAVVRGDSATFTVTAAGDPPTTYQWQHLISGTWTAVGPNAATFTIAAVTPDDAGSYRITVTNSLGTLMSLPANLTVTEQPIVAINAGGKAAGSYGADAFFSGGTVNHTAQAIDTTQVLHPADQAVYQSWRYGDFTYTMKGLTANTTYEVRLDFTKTVSLPPGRRIFNVAINGQTVLKKFDLFAATATESTAVERDFTVTADASGKIKIKFTSIVGPARVSGITISPIAVGP